MNLEVNDYFEYNGDKYQILHKNRNEITVVIRTNRDILIQIKDKNFFKKDGMKRRTENPFCNIKHLLSILNGLQENEEVFFLGYVKYFNQLNYFEKRNRHNVYELLFNTSRRYLSLMISDTPAYELLLDSYYKTTWGYDLRKKEIISLTDMDEITENMLGFTKEYVVVKEPLSINTTKNSICINDILNIKTNLNPIQVEELENNPNSYTLDNKKDFIDRIGGFK